MNQVLKEMETLKGIAIEGDRFKIAPQIIGTTNLITVNVEFDKAHNFVIGLVDYQKHQLSLVDRIRNYPQHCSVEDFKELLKDNDLEFLYYDVK